MTTNQRAMLLGINLMRAEGPAHECDKWVKVKYWREADAVLEHWATTAPADGTYDKVDFIVTWSGGIQYRGRYDLVQKGLPDLAQHIRSNAYFNTGRWTPSHMTAEKHRELLAQNADAREQYENLLATVDLGVEEHPQPLL